MGYLHFVTRRALSSVAALSVLLFLTGCAPAKLLREAGNIPQLESMKNKPGSLRVYDKGTTLYILDDWVASPTDSTISGTGQRINLLSGKKEPGNHAIPYASVALIETDTMLEASNNSFFGSMVIVNVIGYALCATNPKACFGSCPTFYAGADNTICAEGFSASIARAFEAEDVDYLGGITPSGREFTLRVTNEALETHFINSVSLLAVPRGAAGTCWSKAGGFHTVAAWGKLLSAYSAANDITGLLRGADRQEYSVFSDSIDILAKDTIELAFSPADGARQQGLFLAFRQSLMTTFYMYKMIALMGDTYGYWLSRLESADPSVTAVAEDPFLKLGGITIQSFNGSSWVTEGEINETGPLAINYEFLPVSISPQGRYRLIMTKGMWRLDQAALAALSGVAVPVSIAPDAVYTKDSINTIASRLLADPSGYLITNPGDEHQLRFQLPEDFCKYDYYLKSGGYYYEWNREHWRKDKDLSSLVLMAKDPETFLRKYADEFRAMEPMMDKDFWESRYEKR